MAKKFHCMVDLETLSTRSHAAIIQIGGCKFDPDNEDIFDEFCINVDPASSRAVGGHIDKDTMDWWKRQDKEVLASLQTNQVMLSDALNEVSKWYKKDCEIIWSWGSSFDAPVFENAFISCNMSLPWKYWNFRCARTLAKTFGLDKDAGKGAHNAQYDAVDQAKVLQKFFAAMRG